ncbi:MAG: hypothetical protein HQK83_20150, partial [Fibrobacteria bacterium]|nr:hypothetical protein [Fibrobacteria bacterium]
MAALPPAGLIMIDANKLHQISSKQSSGDFVMTFEELIEAGINGVHYKYYTEVAPIYSYAEWVHEAHSYGLWVCGGIPNNGQTEMVEAAVQLASHGVDFLEINLPFDGVAAGCSSWHDPFGENEFLRIKSAALQNCLQDSCPVLITDNECQDKYSGWSSLAGNVTQVYNDVGLNTYLPKAVNFKTGNPDKFAGAWVWSQTWNTFDSVEVSDADFANWFGTVYNQTGNVILYNWTHKLSENEGVYGTNWPARSETIKQVAAKGGAIPEWRNFLPAGAVTRSTPDCQVQVRCPVNGLDPGSVECFYSVDSSLFSTYVNERWVKHKNISVTGTKGTTDWVTITATGVPFNQVTDIHNRIRFKIANIYSGDYFRGAQTFKSTYTVIISSLDWSNLRNDGVISTMPTEIAVDIQRSAGLDVTTASCEFSTDNGVSWQAHGARCSGEKGSTAQETIIAKDIPFVSEGIGINKIRFKINTMSGEVLTSNDYPITVSYPPVFSELTSIRSGDSEINFSVKLHDSQGLRVGSQEAVLTKETSALYHFNGDVKDASPHGLDGVLYGNAAIAEVNSWKSSGGMEQVLQLDGEGDFVDFGFGTIGISRELTISAWVFAENAQAAISLGGVESVGSILVYFHNGKVLVDAVNLTGKSMPELVSPEGNFVYGQWYHVAICFDGKQGQLFLNGKLAVNADWNNFNVFQFKPLRLGKSSNRGGFFKGYLDDVHIINRALTDTEIAAVYSSGMYRTSTDKGASWNNWTQLPGNIQDGSVQEYALRIFRVPLPINNDSLNRIQFMAGDVSGNITLQEYMLLGNDVIPVESEKTLQVGIQAFPNPFRERITISFQLDKPQKITLNIYSVEGRLVQTLASKSLLAGNNVFVWDGRG